jgi:hypothetical protein
MERIKLGARQTRAAGTSNASSVSPKPPAPISRPHTAEGTPLDPVLDRRCSPRPAPQPRPRRWGSNGAEERVDDDVAAIDALKHGGVGCQGVDLRRPAFRSR